MQSTYDRIPASMPELTALDELSETPHATVFETDDPRTIRLELEPGGQLPAHQHPDTNVVLYLRTGTLELTLDEETYTLSADDVIRFDGDQDISPRAREACTALLVFAPAC
jgi:quercetin dioxygenase-like cupin family protein